MSRQLCIDKVSDEIYAVASVDDLNKKWIAYIGIDYSRGEDPETVLRNGTKLSWTVAVAFFPFLKEYDWHE